MEDACPSLIGVIVVVIRELVLFTIFRVAVLATGVARTESPWGSWTCMRKTAIRGMIYKGTD